MAELSKELYSKLLLADSQEEVTALLKAGGREDVPAQEVWEKVQQRRAQDGMELSLDELADVAGGRDWMQEGCAATVEPGSDCWGTDGGCDLCNIEYTNLPTDNCPKCGKLSARVASSCMNISTYTYTCRYCGTVEEKRGPCFLLGA
ncbi:MAG: hypothetical protein K6G17_06380 [Oscillospiraceae bacterium]|nr:hypothetical protein [Oscillospiraceae bacterium]